MDGEAVWNATDDDFDRLGLSVKGHIICLKAFCMPREQQVEKKELLASSIKSTGAERVSPAAKRRKSSHGNRKIFLGWMNF